MNGDIFVIECKPFLEVDFNIAATLVESRFGDGAVRQLERIRQNPMRQVCAEMGDIAYEDGVPASFQACILRRLFWRDSQIVGRVGGMTCSSATASEAAYIDVACAAQKPRGGCRMAFSNSQNEKSAVVSRKLKSEHLGPVSTTRYLWRAIRPLECLMYFVRRKLLKKGLPNWNRFSTLPSVDWEWQDRQVDVRRMSAVSPEFFDVLMKRYVTTNRGLVSSRTAEEIEWIWGDRIKSGEAVVLGAFENEEPVGYILLKSNEAAKRWVVHDWFALGNDEDRLEVLIRAALRFLKTKTPAMMFEVEGFPTWVQPLLKRYFPHVREIGHNQFSWKSKDKELRVALEQVIDSRDSWFFGPYDGDECMS